MINNSRDATPADLDRLVNSGDLTADPRLACQCPDFADSPCVGMATQEDFRCDTCRLGCTRITLTELRTGTVRHHPHVKPPYWASRA